MIEMCSCYGCGSSSVFTSGGGSVRDSPHHHHLNNHHHNSTKSSSSQSTTMGHSIRCFSPQFPVRTGRSLKGACLLTATLAFCVGIGVGILIPLYFLPVNVDTFNILHPTTLTSSMSDGGSNSNSNIININSKEFQHLTLTPQPVIMNEMVDTNNNNNMMMMTPTSALNNNNDRTFYRSNNDDSLLPPPPSSASSSSDDSVSNRFPEFAQIQALRQEDVNNNFDNSNNNNHVNSNIVHKRDQPHQKQQQQQTYPSFRRPSTSSVKFVVPDSRILSLHPVQPEVPPARFNLTSSSSSSSDKNDNNNNNLEQEQQQPHKKDKKLHSSTQQLIDGIYWSREVEKYLPKGFTDDDIKSWRRFVKDSVVSKIEEGCGRMQNRLLSLENGTRACCRYRHNFDQIQGEIFSFYLSQILNIRNLAPSALNIIQPLDPKWSRVRQQLNLAQWVDEKPVVLTRFIDSLTQAYIPSPFQSSNRRLHPIDLVMSPNLLDEMDVNELAQWSDLIVFDYLTANLDRMVNNLYNLQWNPSMMEAPAHNLAKETTTGLLVFLDNESGLLHGYRLLDKYEQYHRVMLDCLCVFRKSTADAVKRLHRDKNVGHLLKTMFQNLEPTLVNYLPIIPDKSIKILNHRIDRVYDQINKCESLYMS